MTDLHGAFSQTVTNVLEHAETQSFATLGVRVIWTNTYDEIPPLLVRIRQGLNMAARGRSRDFWSARPRGGWVHSFDRVMQMIRRHLSMTLRRNLLSRANNKEST